MEPKRESSNYQFCWLLNSTTGGKDTKSHRPSCVFLYIIDNALQCVLSVDILYRLCFHNIYFKLSMCKGRVRLPIKWILDKFQTAFNPPPPLIFGTLYCKFLWQIWLRKCEEIWWLDSMKCMHMISSYRYNTIVENNIPWTLKLLFCINFMIKKPCSKFPKSAI